MLPEHGGVPPPGPERYRGHAVPEDDQRLYLLTPIQTLRGAAGLPAPLVHGLLALRTNWKSGVLGDRNLLFFLGLIWFDHLLCSFVLLTWASGCLFSTVLVLCLHPFGSPPPPASCS